jgi:hypothetical protein
VSSSEVNAIEIYDDYYSFGIVITDANGNAQRRIAEGAIPVSLNPNERHVFGLLDRDYAVYTIRALEIAGSIFWRVFRHPSILASDYPSTILPAVELVYEHSAVKATLGYGYGYGYVQSYGEAYAEVYKGDVYIYIQYPKAGNSTGMTVIACPAGVFAFTTAVLYRFDGDGTTMAVARTADGSLIRAYAKTGAGLA